MSRRGLQRVDYRELNSIGKIVHVISDQPHSATSNFLNMDDNGINLKRDITILSEEILDIVDENPIDGNLPKNVDATVSRLEQQRTSLRSMMNQFSTDFPDDYITIKDDYEKTLLMIKDYIKSGKNYQIKSKLRESINATEDATRKERSTMFVLKDIQRCIHEIEIETNRDINAASNEALLAWYKESTNIDTRITNIASRYQQVLCEPISSDDMLHCIKDIGSKYTNLTELKCSFKNALDKEIADREIYKQKLFDETKLCIKLEKFCGYDSKLDIYSFRTAFEKLYNESTPKRLMPDLLKNNFLLDPALSLVKFVPEINDIWQKLEYAYGDTKVMLTNKLSTLSKLTSLSKVNDSKLLADGLSKIINVMKELMQLAKKYRIEHNLYYGNGLDKIYQLLGDGRLTRWLTTMDEKIDLPRDTWTKLIRFLEKEQRIQLQKTAINNFKEKPSTNQSSNAKSRVNNKNFFNAPPAQHSNANGFFNAPPSQHFSTNDFFNAPPVQHSNANGFFNAPPVQHSNANGFFNAPPSQHSNINNFIPPFQPSNNFYTQPPAQNSAPICFFCNGKSNHTATNGPGGTKLIQYFACKDFAEKTPAARLALLREKNYCIQCLFPGASSSDGKHKDGRCQRDFICTHQSHQSYAVKKHVLVCDEHKNHDENRRILEQYRHRCIRSADLPQFSRDIKLSFHSCNNTSVSVSNSNDCIKDRGIYLFQTICIGGKQYTIFFDNGCSDFVVKQSAVESLGQQLATQESSQSILLGGVGNTCTRSNLGTYSVKVPIYDGSSISLSGVCLENITAPFPQYPLTRVNDDICSYFKSIGGDPKTLPELPSSIGGTIDFMLGVKYLRYHPKLILQLPSGLSIYESVFINADGGRGVIGGPHEVFTNIHQQFFNSSSTFFTEQYSIYRSGFQVNPDVPLLGFKSVNSTIDQPSHHDETKLEARLAEGHLTTQQRVFEEVEAMGSEVTFRCTSCRNCKDCKNHQEIESISLKEEAEQGIINSSVKVNLSNQTTTANLPLIADPLTRLAPNKMIAMKVYQQQVRKLNIPNNKDDKKDILESEGKLQQLGYVDFVRNLPSSVQASLSNHPVQNFIPWRAVWKGNSISTPCRIVFDASQSTSTGYSLNDILAKGRNNLNKLQEILIRWSIHQIALHTDVKKMYNTVKLNESDWCYQRYIWQADLQPGILPEEKIIKTLIYGVKSSGNQAEYGLRKVAELSKSEYPEVNNTIQKDVYVDDCISGEENRDAAYTRADQLELVLNRGGFQLKGVTFSGEDPPAALTDDGVSIHVGGLRWFPKDDVLSLNIGDLNFSKKHRGKKSPDKINIIPERLTRRHCSSKVAEIFDLTGKVSAVVASMKLDLQELVNRKLDWDDVIPDELRSTWEKNFEVMKEIGTLRFRRAIVPEDAVNLNINTLDFGDASQSLVCVCIYARFLRRNGQYSCQLIFSRTRVVPRGMTMPRAELYAALINTHTGEIVKRSLQHWHTSSIKFTDSQVALHWICNEDKPLKQWVRNRVVEILRFTSKQQWHYIQTTDMIADIGTRKGTTVKDVDQSSVWTNGYQWMQSDSTTFKMSTAEELRLNETEISEANKEHKVQVHHNKPIIPEDVQNRYTFSRYLIDPNHRTFSSVVRILAYVMRYINILSDRVKKQPAKLHQTTLTTKEIRRAEKYFFQKGCDEVKKFLPSSKYSKISTDKDGLLIYTGRILPTSEVTVVGKFTNSMKDLCPTSFCVPVIDRHSPVAFSLVSDIHWNNNISRHAGIETTYRLVLKSVYIIEGRQLIKLIKRNCQRCRYLEKRTVEIAMGPASTYNLTIAPAFYYTQLDLSGPHLSYSPHHKRTTVKIWLVIFCCCATSTVSIKVMDDYSSTAFIQAFTRFACDNGFPKRLLCDEGSQLMKGCRDMKYNFRDVRNHLINFASVEFDVCPVQGHNMHGKVERKIKEVNKSLEKLCHKQRLSLLQWETISSIISNSINDLPIALGNVTGDFEVMDLLTPNRLRMGRNNDRSPVGDMVVSTNPSKILKENSKVFNAWFETWLLVHVPRLMHHPKWYKSEMLEVGDVVLFLKHDSELSSTYTYGVVVELEFSNDNLARKAKVKYRNANENVSRETFRSVRSLVVIHGVDESDIMTELGEMAEKVDVKSKNLS